MLQGVTIPTRKARKNRVIILEDLNFIWDTPELEESGADVGIGLLCFFDSRAFQKRRSRRSYFSDNALSKKR
jgi:hypothetical protein